MKTIIKDILTIEKGIVVHQCNAQKNMGAGIAKLIKRKWSIAFQVYKSSPQKLGTISAVEVDPGIVVANLIGQDRYGGQGRTFCYTDYNAIRKGFRALKDHLPLYEQTQAYVPYGMGCGLAGGNWDMYSMIIDEECPGTIACKLR